MAANGPRQRRRMNPALPSSLCIRPMTARDLRRVVAMEATCFGSEAWPLHTFKELLGAFAKAEPTRGEMWIAEDPGTGELLGYAGVEVSALWGEMDVINVAVAPEHRRRGVGQSLMRWIMDLCRQEGVPLLWLRVRASNRGARRFYRSLGFRQRGRFDGYYLDPDEPAIIMAMEVDARPVAVDG
jgi:[ribosomal protein S18]-alanine N-acetyltransferase